MVKVRAMSDSLFARFLLITALLFAQMGGLTHGISHTLADQSSKQSQDQSVPHNCELCAAYAQLGNALGSHAIAFSAIEQQSALIALTFDTFRSTAPFNAYASRAPPYSV